MWSHEAEHGDGGNRREGGERNMAAIHGRTVQKGPKRNRLLQRKHIYEDEPAVMEIEVKEALTHISSRKSARCDGIPIELLKVGGEEAVKVMTGLCNCIWKRRNGRKTERNGVRANL